MRRKATLTSGPVGKTLAFLALPMIMGVFSKSVYNLTDTWFVSRLGTEALAAMSFTFPIVMVIGGISMGIGTGTGSVVSRAIGHGNGEIIKRYVTDAFLLGFALILIMSIIGLLTIEPLFTLLGATPETLPLVREYMSIWYLGLVFLVVPMIGNHCIRATGNTTYPSVVMLISAVINIILDPILIFGLMGVPALGLKGAAVATVIARALTFFAALWYLSYKEKVIDYKIPQLSETLASWKQIMYIAIPAALSRLLIPTAMAIVTRLAADIGPAAVAAVGAGIKVSGFTRIPLRALSTSTIPFVGQNWGAGEFDRVNEGRVKSIQFSLIWGFTVVGIFMFAADDIARSFSADPEVIRNITLFLWIDPVAHGFRGMFMVSNALLNAINKPYVSATLMVARLALLYIPLVYTGLYFGGLIGMFIGMALGNILGGLIAMVIARKTIFSEWDRKILINGQESVPRP